MPIAANLCQNNNSNSEIEQQKLFKINENVKLRKLSEHSHIIKILIVDDEIFARNTIKRYINKINKTKLIEFNIIYEEADNCFKAIEIIYDNFLVNQFFNFVIIDECMPYMKGSTLINLLRELNEENYFYKMIFISYTSFDTIEKKKYIIGKGADEILNKPVTYEQFSSLINILVNKNSIEFYPN